MSHKVTDIVKDVEICMDEIAPNDGEMDMEQDDTERATIIRSKIADALRFVYAHADWTLLEPDKIVTSQPVVGKNPDVEIKTMNGITYGYYELPDDFLRLCYAGFDSWTKQLGHEDMILWSDPEHSMLRDPYATGTADRPKMAMKFKGSKRVLELYSKNPDEQKMDCASIGIMLEPSVPADLGAANAEVNIGNKVYRAVIYYIAGLTYITYNNAQAAQTMFTEANDLMGFSEAQNNK